ncbi:MAG TPA: ABC transporter permease [Elusimicrobiota bacterium]|jgi:phospholipid/cholesterol/gamma-HCH transport system permease protein|nr:ABC transporter permease [Elusimicrobiota bacterium]
MSRTALSDVGQACIDLAEETGKGALLVRSTVYWLGRGRIEWKQAVIQMMRIGVESFPVSAMTSLFTGMVLALQTGSSFKNLFNEPLFTGTIVSYAIVKELGPVMTALVVSGRAGAAVAAELGTMKVTEQLDALSTLGTDPVRYLVIPRVIAFFVMLPLLTVFSNFAGVIGGCIVSYLKLGIPTKVYWDDVFNHMDNMQLKHGMYKTFVFAICIAFICCYKGINTKGGAEGVGRATTSAVVASMTAVLIIDYFLTAILVAVGIT